MKNAKESILEILIKTSKDDGAGLESTTNAAFGDYTTNIALQSDNPKDYAEKLAGKLIKDSKLSSIAEVSVAGGFINFWLKKDVLVDNLIQIDAGKEKYGQTNIGKGKTVIIDYSSPNIAKAFGIGHLRSTIIGQSLYNIYKALGYEVVGDNHLGDWGTQFGKLIYMIETKKPEKLDIQTLEDLYVEFHKMAEKDPSIEEEARNWFKKLEDGDEQAKKTWQECVDVSMREFDRIYDLLGVKIDFAFGEAYYQSEMKQMISDPQIKKHLEKGEDGALIIDLGRMGIKTPLMFLKSDGATTYATRDLATLRFRERKWDPAIIIYEVGAEQGLHFKQIFAAAKMLGIVKDSVQLVHTAHGLYLGSNGKKFSTRKGETIKLEEVLDEAITRAKKLGNSGEVAKQVGIGAIKYFDLMHSVGSDVVFDWEKIMNLEGNSGPYLQYTVARTNSVLEKGAKITFDKLDTATNLADEETALLRALVKYTDVIASAAVVYSPNLVCNYLFDLAQKYNHFYNTCPILEEKTKNRKQSEFRLALTAATGQVLKNGLHILGIETPEKM